MVGDEAGPRVRSTSHHSAYAALRLEHRAGSWRSQTTLRPVAPQLQQSRCGTDGAQLPSAPSTAFLPAAANRDSTVTLAG